MLRARGPAEYRTPCPECLERLRKMEKLSKYDIIEEINDLLDSLPPVRCHEMLSKLTLIDLVWLKQAIEAKLVKEN